MSLLLWGAFLCEINRRCEGWRRVTQFGTGVPAAEEAAGVELLGAAADGFFGVEAAAGAGAGLFEAGAAAPFLGPARRILAPEAGAAAGRGASCGSDPLSAHANDKDIDVKNSTEVEGPDRKKEKRVRLRHPDSTAQPLALRPPAARLVNVERRWRDLRLRGQRRTPR